jgi:aryl-alcohol dehydrogenase-like predicted oxidoreductase
VHPIAALQTEYSLWTRNPEIAVLEACRELGTTFVAFSPLARGFLPGTLRDVTAFDAKDIRRAMPRFAPEAYAANLALANGLLALAAEGGTTAARLSLAWLLAQGEHIVPIPGTTRIDHLDDDLGAAELTLPPSLLARAGALINQQTVRGARYNAATQGEVDTEEF